MTPRVGRCGAAGSAYVGRSRLQQFDASSHRGTVIVAEQRARRAGREMSNDVASVRAACRSRPSLAAWARLQCRPHTLVKGLPLESNATETASLALTTCDTTADGTAISIGFIGRTGRPAAVEFPVDQIGALIVTLPGLIDKALRRRFRDDSLRFTYPLGSWAFERSSDSATNIVTLRTVDGFEVRFSIQQSQQIELGEALIIAPSAHAVLRAN